MPPIEKVKTAAEVHSPPCYARTRHHSSPVHLTIRMRKGKDWKLIRHGKLGGGENKHARVQELVGEGTNSRSNIPPRDRRRPDDVSLQKKMGQIRSGRRVIAKREL
jgi:hypothetical protein